MTACECRSWPALSIIIRGRPSGLFQSTPYKGAEVKPQAAGHLSH